MCSGYFSSKIRDKREGLPPMKNPYDDTFVEQVTEFMPYLTDMKFLGGEPFMIKQYLSIWERVLEVNPKIRIHITTNATLLHGRIKEVVSRLKAGFVISIDSVEPESYAMIRKGGELSSVLKNVEELQKIAKANGTYVTIAACVMRSNWMDLPNLVRYANQRNMNVHFNLVWNPESESIRFLSEYEISDIVSNLQSQLAEIHPVSGRVQKGNVRHLEDVVESLQYWAKEREGVRENLKVDLKQLEQEKQKLDAVGNQLLDAYLAYYTENDAEQSGLSSKGSELMKEVQRIKESTDVNRSFFQSYMAMATSFSELAYPERDLKQFKQNKKLVFETITSDYQIQEAINEMCQAGLISQIDFLHATPKQQLLETLQAKFYIKD
jgi:organic radical activating enzyme